MVRVEQRHSDMARRWLGALVDGGRDDVSPDDAYAEALAEAEARIVKQIYAAEAKLRAVTRAHGDGHADAAEWAADALGDLARAIERGDDWMANDD